MEDTQTQALALRYRPINFDELVGQESVSRTLSLALGGKRLSHAYLFSGLRGSGKTSSARIFARCLECDNGPTSKPCGVCKNCEAANPHKMRHIDIIELDGASNRKIDDIRDLIEQTKYHPAMGRFKIFIIDEVHMLTKEAFNALLKTLEEPPPYVKFILATTDPLKLPATILSRTQHFRFKRISDRSILEHLRFILHKENIEYEEEALLMLIRSGAGSLRDTLTLLDQVIIYSNYNITINACASMLGLINPQSLSELFDLIFQANKEEVLQRLSGFFDYESEMLLDEMSVFIKDKLIKGDDSRYSVIIVDRFFRIISQAKQLLFLGSDDSFVLTLVVFKMIESLKIQEIDKAIESLENSVLLKQETKVSSKQESNHELQDTTHMQHMQITSNDLFVLLVEKIYERNYDLGEIFEKNIKFVSFENGILEWVSSAIDDDKDRLSKSYGAVIKPLILEIFGENTTLKVTKEEIKQEENKVVQDTKPTTKEEIEKEVKDILNTPLLKDMQDIFGVTTINVNPLPNKE
ncbi:DNA polymerase III subunit gamma/tau [Helicobacter ibis]|uniref:DNA polymerase III subunit gamma/tau n=1 Tax=Helicobacter ibis TaxID=2962633 RepID=A0ABT4VEB1_9HELI|nr:DNA polymerase III subunit gamma/tau [Helicobacter ibis]MDA3969029.1 DNA polymerase III subunit gamma/tau [Helicobacter ibis]